jgi:hypothetical protein
MHGRHDLEAHVNAALDDERAGGGDVVDDPSIRSTVLRGSSDTAARRPLDRRRAAAGATVGVPG